MYDGIFAETTTISGDGGDLLEAYLARPLGGNPVGSVVVIHHLPGYDAATKEIARHFATLGYAAVMPNLYSREAPGARPDDAAAMVRAMGGVPDGRLVGDVAGAAAYMRALPYTNGKVAAIGYCSGGRQAFLAATSIELDAAVDCYGAFIVGPPPEGSGLKMVPIVDRAPLLHCPLLGLFGADDKNPSPTEVGALKKALDDAGKTSEFHTYDDAGHGFFASDRPSYRPAAAVEGWQRINEFFTRYLAA
jgi:carboxymethylenebutenolidase